MEELYIEHMHHDDQDYCLFGIRLVSLKTRNASADPRLVYQVHKNNLSNFVNMLYDPCRSASITIRTIIDPHGRTNAAGEIVIGLLVKFPLKPGNGEVQCQADTLYKTLRLLLGGSFNEYIWTGIKNRADLQALLEPLDWQKAFIAEVRRRHEHIRLDTLVRQRGLGFLEREDQPAEDDASHEQVYYVHPFLPTINGFERLLKTFLQGEDRVILTSTITPTILNPSEAEFLGGQIAYCEGHKPPDSSSERIFQQRSIDLSQALLRQHMLLQDAPFILTFSVASPKPIDPMLMEYAGLAITEPIGQSLNASYHGDNFGFQYGGYDILIPQTDEQYQVARQNLRYLSQILWGDNAHLPPEKQRLRSLFDGNEAVSAFYLPVNAEEELPGIETHSLEERPIPRSMIALKEGIEPTLCIGKNHYFGFEQDVVIPESTRRQHTYIVGQTGTGKTTLLKTMILSDMKAGNGLAVIDPHGEMYHDLLEMIPAERMKDVVLFDPSDVEFPVGFNLLEVKNEEEREFIVKEMRAILKRYVFEYFKIQSGEIAGPIFFQHSQNNMLLTASDIKNPGTILEFYHIFESQHYWRRWLPLKWKNKLLESWVNNVMENTNYAAENRDGSRYGDYFGGKYVDFVNDPRIANIFGQPFSTINLSDVIEKKKIFLVNLSKGLIGEANSSMLGMILMAKLNAAFMQRLKKVSEGQDVEPFYLYVDEFQTIATENFSILLAEARKFGLGLILANQYMRQIDEMRIVDAILGNVGTIISFRLGIDDAKRIESQFYPQFSFQELCNLPNYYAVMRTNIKGTRTTPCNLQTVLTDFTQPFAGKAAVIAHSRASYGMPRALAEQVVDASLAEPRFGSAQFYYEKEGTPPEQLIRKLEPKAILDLSKVKPDTYPQLIAEIDYRARAQIINYLLYQKHLPKKKVLAVYEALVKNEPGLIFKNYRILDLAIKPHCPSCVEEVTGILNHVWKTLVQGNLAGLVDFAVDKDNLAKISAVTEHCLKDNWKEVSKGLIEINVLFRGIDSDELIWYWRNGRSVNKKKDENDQLSIPF